MELRFHFSCCGGLVEGFWFWGVLGCFGVFLGVFDERGMCFCDFGEFMRKEGKM